MRKAGVRRQKSGVRSPKAEARKRNGEVCLSEVTTLDEIFRDMDEIRKRSKLPRGVSVKDLIEEGRM
jgi:hypothetical protein